MTPKRKTNFVSPRKFSRKELELDRIVGNKMRQMSEKKKLRRSMLDNSDSTVLKEITQDPLNQSADVYRAKYANYSRTERQPKRDNKPKLIGTEINMPLNTSLKIHDSSKNKILLDRTDPVVVRNKLEESTHTANNENNDSIRRSDVRGLEVLLSEKSQEVENKDHQSSHSKHDESEEGKTLKYGTDERTDRSGGSGSKKSQKEAMYDQLEKIMGN